MFLNPPQPETGVSKINLPNDLTELSNAASSANGKKYTGDIWVTLDGKSPSVNGDGMAYIRQTKTGPIKDSIRLSDPNFNGVILATGVANVSGTLDGSLTIASYSTPTATSNNIVVQGDILYEKNPLNGTSDDRLGLVANNDVVVADNVPAGGNREIDAEHIRPRRLVHRRELQHAGAQQTSSGSSAPSSRIPGERWGRLRFVDAPARFLQAVQVRRQACRPEFPSSVLSRVGQHDVRDTELVGELPDHGFSVTPLAGGGKRPPHACRAFQPAVAPRVPGSPLFLPPPL